MTFLSTCLLRLKADARIAKSAVITLQEFAASEVGTHIHGPKRVRWNRRFSRWARRIIATYNFDMRVDGTLPTVDQQRATLILCTHRSPFDVALVVALFSDIRFLSRADVANWPVLGSAAKRAETVFVDRESRRSGHAAIKAMRAALKKGKNVCVFPEGKTGNSDTVQAIRSGAFRAIEGLDVQVILLGLSYPEGIGWTEGSFAAHARSLSRASTLPIGVAGAVWALYGQAGPEGLGGAAQGRQSPAASALEAREKLQDLVRLAAERRIG